MKRRRTRTVALALAIAIIPAGAAGQISDELRLKLEKQMRMAPPSRPDRDSARDEDRGSQRDRAA